MPDWAASLARWWSSGSLFTPVMLAVSLALYAMIGERLWSLALAPPPPPSPGADGDGGRDLTRGFTLIRALTISLPLLGLLGTVSGMVGTFASLALRGATTLSQGAGAGIAEALVSTQFGILLAVPAMVALWYLRARAERLARAAAAPRGAP